MKFILEINNKTAQKITKKFLLSVFKRTLEEVQLDYLKEKTIELSVAIVELDEMHRINNEYRAKNKPTDVLSFYEFENTKELFELSKMENDIFIGELIICPEYIANNAKIDGETFDYALKYITSHGILHLLGFAHGKKMFDLQRSVADQLTNV